MIEIDYERCVGCLCCVDKCIRNTIVVKDRKPMIDKDRPCVKCFHCAIACRSNAISFEGNPAVSSRERMIPDLSFFGDLEAFMMTRRSYRDFSNKIVPKEEILHAIEVSSWAPSTKNQHPTKYYIISGKEKIDKIMDIILRYIKKTGKYSEIIYNLQNGLNSVFTKSQTVIMAYANDSAINPQTDAAIALAYIELLLQSKGIGTCWAGYLTTLLNEIDEMKQLFCLPQNHSFYGGLMVGYPLEKYYYIPERIERSQVKEL